MADDTLVVRKVDKTVYRKFKQKAVEENTSVGRAITEAMHAWTKRKQKKKLNPAAILELNGIIKTKGKVRWSEEIDKALYG